MTEQGQCYLKALGNKEGPHALACEWVGTALADWFGLRTVALSKLAVDADDEIELGHGRRATPGPAIAARAEAGSPWGGTQDELRALVNPDDITRLVVFDTWSLNCDRHPPDLATRKPNYDNVYLSAENAASGQFALTAMDHTHSFACGRELTGRIAGIDRVKDSRIYGLFPEFVAWLREPVLDVCLNRLAEMDRLTAEQMVDEIEPDWQVSAAARSALVDLIKDRAQFVADAIRPMLFP